MILALKSVRRIVKAHEVQLVNSLSTTGKQVDLILDFGTEKVKRKLMTLLQEMGFV